MSIGQRALRALVRTAGVGRALVRHRTGLLVLMYHSVHSPEETTEYTYSTSVETFREHMAYLDDVATFVDLDDVFSPERSGGSGSLGVHVTFDDGYRNVLTEAYPVLRRHNVPATIFLTTAFAGGGYESFLDWDDLGEFDDELVTVGSHCRRHVNLTAMSKGDVREELEESKATIESKIDSSVDYLSYPGGGYNAQVQRLAERAGYRAAFADRLHLRRRNDHPFAFGRMSVDKTNEMFEAFVSSLATSPTVEC